MCLHCIGKVSNCSIKSCGRCWSAHEGTINAHSKALLGKNCLSSHSCHLVKIYFFWTKLLHAYVQCVYIVKATYQIVPLKAVAGVDRPMTYTNTLLGNNCLSTHSCHFVIFFLNETPSCICSMCLHCIDKVSNCSIKSCGRSWSAHGGTINAYTNILSGKNCLSSHSCHFVKKKISGICSMCLHCIWKVSNCSIKSCGRSWSARVWTTIA